MLTLKDLDDILTVISNTTESYPKPQEWIFNRNFNPLLPEYSLRNQASILHKLKKEGYIDSVPANELANKFPKGLALYFITFDGLMLLETEKGYEGRLKKSNLASVHQKRMENITLFFSGLVTLGTCIAAGFAYATFFYNHQDNHSSYLFKFEKKCISDSQKMQYQLIQQLPIKSQSSAKMKNTVIHNK